MASEAKKLLKNLPTTGEMQRILGDLKSQPDAQVVLMGAAYLDNALKLLLKSHFRELAKEDWNSIFGENGGAILGTFSSKIRLAYAMGLLGPKIYADLLLFNHIRNAFAHTLHDVSFSTPEIKSDIEKLSAIREARQEAGYERLLQDPAEVLCDTIWTFYAGIYIEATEPRPINRQRGKEPQTR